MKAIVSLSFIAFLCATSVVAQTRNAGPPSARPPIAPPNVGRPVGPDSGPPAPPPQGTRDQLPWSKKKKTRAPITIETARPFSRKSARIGTTLRVTEDCKPIMQDLNLMTSISGPLTLGSILTLRGNCLVNSPTIMMTFLLSDIRGGSIEALLHRDSPPIGTIAMSEQLVARDTSTSERAFLVGTSLLNTLEFNPPIGLMIYMTSDNRDAPSYTAILNQADIATLRAGGTVTRSSSPFPP